MQAVRGPIASSGRGLGGRLVEEFFAWSRERGAERFHVSAYAANDAAIRFYRRHGFALLCIELPADVLRA